VIREERNSATGLKATLLQSLDLLLRNPYSKIYHRAHDILNRNSDLSCLRLNPQLRLIPNKNEDPRRYNLPTVNSELAVLIPDILPRHPSLSAFRSRLYGKWRAFFDQIPRRSRPLLATASRSLGVLNYLGKSKRERRRSGIDRRINSIPSPMTVTLCSDEAGIDRIGPPVKVTNLLSGKKIHSGIAVGWTSTEIEP
jgi:hypothetical protein